MTVIIGIDPHKRSHTAVALDEHDRILDQLRIDADATQLRRLLRFARRWPERTWAIENANGLGRLLARQLVDADQVVVDVPAPLQASAEPSHPPHARGVTLRVDPDRAARPSPSRWCTRAPSSPRDYGSRGVG